MEPTSCLPTLLIDLCNVDYTLVSAPATKPFRSCGGRRISTVACESAQSQIFALFHHGRNLILAADPTDDDYSTTQHFPLNNTT